MALKSAKRVAWQAFSKFIRLRDCLKFGNSESGQCVSCGRSYPFNQTQAGHFIAGRYNAILFDEDIVHLQCYSCNVSLHGNILDYRDFMLKHYTEEQVEELRRRKNLSVKFTEQDYLNIKKHYEERYQELEKYKDDRYNPKLRKLLEYGKTFENPQ